jgi:hypothetical protein
MTDKTTPTGEVSSQAAANVAPNRLRWIMAALAAATFAVCCLRLFVLPHTALVLWGDAPGYAIKGVRLLGGELPYRDFFEFLTPGTDIVYALLFRCFGVSLWVIHLVMASLAALAALWMTWGASRLVRGWFVVLPAALLMGFVLGFSLDPTHHWFSTVALMGAIWILFGGHSLGRVAGAGAFCGLAASFTQTKGAAAVIGLVIYFVWLALREEDRTGQWRRRGLTRVLVLCGAALAVFALINGRFILACGVGRWAWDVVVFPVRYFGSVSMNNLSGAPAQFAASSGVLKWTCIPFEYLVVPLTYVWFFVRLWRARADRQEPWNQLMLVAMVGIAMLAAVTPAMSMRRISAASPPTLLLLTWLLSGSGLLSSSRKTGAAVVLGGVAVALGAASVAVAAAQIAVIQLRPARVLDLPVGRVAILPGSDYYDIYRWMEANTKPGQWYFGLAPLALAFELRNPTPMAEISPGEYTRPEQVASIVQGIERARVPVIVLRPMMYSPSWNLPDHLQPFRNDLYLHYRKTKSFASGDEIWERVDK